MASVEVIRAQSGDDLKALYEFRYRVYVEEYAMAKGVGQEQKKLQDQYDDEGINFSLRIDGEVVGSLRVLFLDQLSDPAPLIDKFSMHPVISAFGLNSIMTTSRFMVAPQLRSTTSIFRLIRAAFEIAIASNKRFNYGDCSPHLLPFYEQLGYRRYGNGFNDSSYGYKLPILMLVADLTLFKQVRSPLQRLLSEEGNDIESHDWFAQKYPDYTEQLSAGFMPEEQFFDRLAERLSSDPQHAAALLKGLNRDQAIKFLSQATVIKINEGDQIIRKGDRDNSLYVLLKGLADVHGNKQSSRPVATIGPGDTFGEIGFLTSVPRTANVIARTNSEVLLLSGEFFTKLTKSDASIAAVVLHNLAGELAARLTVTTKFLTNSD